MPAPQLPKYQAIHAELRRQILAGELAPGSQLPPQPELAAAFGVTLMTLRQAVSALEVEGLVWAARGKGTFVSDKPVDIQLGNLSSFSQQMRAAGVAVDTELLDMSLVSAGEQPAARRALGLDGGLLCLTRRRSSGAVAFSLQRSFLEQGLGGLEGSADFAGDSLYDTIEAATGWTVVEARESITAVALDQDAAARLDAQAGHPSLLSVRTSINQFGRPFLYDEALLVGGRCTIVADRTSERLSLGYRVPD